MADAPRPIRDPIRPTDAQARDLARGLVRDAGHGALGVLDPATGGPHVTRVAVMGQPDGSAVLFVSALSHHTRALRAHPACSLLLGEPGAKGDPLTHPRLTLLAQAAFVPQGSDAHRALRAAWLTRHPKARVYADLPDFAFAILTPTGAHLNGGFGRAFVLTPDDLGPG
ncbi:MAG: pyridoxamine 5'-phosphate oxidase family protein [Rhodobacteraceae bacterium]|nr:pyridoxamine 5'-phosphate oxidase family protein [Paracoccaceae bacterium]